MLSDATGDGPTIRIAIDDGHPATPFDLALDQDLTVHQVGSTGRSGIEPLAMVTTDGRTAVWTRITPTSLETVLEKLSEGFDAAVADAAAVVDHESQQTTRPGLPVGGLDLGERRLLGLCGWLRPSEPGDYETAGGFTDPELETMRELGGTIRGRGWGDWAQDSKVGDSWDRTREAPGEPTVVINAHGNRGDRLLCTSAPFEVLAGAQAVARYVEAGSVIAFCSEAAEHAARTVETAAAGFPDPTAPVSVVTGPDVHRAAEPTMAIEAIEGNHRLEARLRPPGPDEVGIDGDPTVVHTARTLAQVGAALRTGKDPRTRLVTVTGDIEAPGTVELREDAALADALPAAGVEDDFKAACVGGRFGGMTTSLDLPPAPERLADADLGTEGTVHLLDDDRCVLQFVGERTQVAADANCGRCVPCREGTTQMANELRSIYDGTFETERITELCRVMATSSICAFGIEAARPARTAVQEFEDELAAHARGRCPAGACPEPAEVTQ